MNYRELQQQIEQLEQQIKDLKVKLESKAEPIPIPYKPYEVELPEEDTMLYYFNGDCKIDFLYFYDDIQYVVERYKKGFCFETKEEAEQHLKESKLIFKLKQWAKEKNAGWEPDWENIGQSKHYIEIDMNAKEFTAWHTSYISRFTKLPYFKSQEIAQACIDEFGEEIKEVLC